MIFGEISGAFIRTAAGYILVLLLVRIMGRKLIGEMTFFDFIIAVTLGSTTANFALGTKHTTLGAGIVLVTLTGLAVTTGFLFLKSFRLRKFLNSEPVTVIENGKIVVENLKKIRITINSLLSHLREKNIFNIADVEFAIMETDGELSVLPKSQKQPLTPKDIKLPTHYEGLTKDLIIDGEIMAENLKESNLDAQWLKENLKIQGVNDPREVFYAGLDTTGSLYVSIKRKTIEKHGKYGIE